VIKLPHVTQLSHFLLRSFIFIHPVYKHQPDYARNLNHVYLGQISYRPFELIKWVPSLEIGRAEY